MKSNRLGFRVVRIAVAILLAALFVAGPLPAAAAVPAKDPGWPREVDKDGTRLVYYQPQIDEWKGYRELSARVAFSLTPKGGKPTPGIASLKARTITDTEARTVVIKTIQIEDVRFPSLDEKADKEMGKLFEKLFPTQGMTLSLDRVLAAAEKPAAPAHSGDVKNDPPQIFVSQSPSILLFVDGEIAYAPIDGTSLKFVVNTNWDLFWNEATSHYYLLDGKRWLTSGTLNGDWSTAKSLPADMAKLPSGQNFDDVKAMIPPQPVSGAAPRVFFTSMPAEIILFHGAPVWVEIPKTRLLYAKNTDSQVFVQKDENQYYYLVSGRWFRAKSFDGPWTFASADLPKDFAQIPPKGPKGDILASVPGTQEASDAVLLAQIPTTVIVNRVEAEAAVKVAYDGAPQFKPIENTGCAYATNTQDKVIQVGDLYYLCFQGVWFMSTNPNGPWKTCDSVPKEIYTIPASCPVHNVTYVTVSNPTPTTVECSSTSGYVGAFVIGMSVGVAVVYGSGWYYPPYFWYGPYPYPIYRPWPYSYGYGAFYNPYNGMYGHVGVAYGPYGMAGGAAWYNPSTGRYGRASTVQTPWGGRTVSGGYNPWTGTSTGRVGGWNAYGSWGSSAVQRGNDWAVSNRVSNSQGTVRHTYGSEGGSMTKVRTDQGTVRVGQDSNNNMYAGKDGNVYKKDSSGSWSKYENGGWNSVDKPQGQPKASTNQAKTRETSASGATHPATSQSRPSSGSSWSGSDVSKDLNRDASARQRGSDRASTYSRGSSGSSGRTRSSAGGGARRR